MNTRSAIARFAPGGLTASTVAAVPAPRAGEHGVGALRRLLRRVVGPGGRAGAQRRPSAPPGGRWVAAVVTDDLAAVEVTRVARRLAREGKGRLLLLVPQPAGGFTTEPMVHVMMQRWREEAALAIVGRVLPVLEDPAAPVREIRTQIVPHGSVSWSGRRPDGELEAGPVLSAVLSAARRAGADILVAPAVMLGASANDGPPVLVDVDRRRVMPADTPPAAPAATPTAATTADVEVAPPAAATR